MDLDSMYIKYESVGREYRMMNTLSDILQLHKEYDDNRSEFSIRGNQYNNIIETTGWDYVITDKYTDDGCITFSEKNMSVSLCLGENSNEVFVIVNEDSIFYDLTKYLNSRWDKNEMKKIKEEDSLAWFSGENKIWKSRLAITDLSGENIENNDVKLNWVTATLFLKRK
jgi:hypothetical protein